MEDAEELPVENVEKKSKRSRRRKGKKPTVEKIQCFEFAELNIRHTGDPTRTLNMVKRAIRMGYDSVAINIDVGELSPPEPEEPPVKKKKKGAVDKQPAEVKSDWVPDPFQVDESLLDLTSLETRGKKFRQFSRLTVTLTDSTSIYKLQHHPKRSRYDIVAIRCPDENILTTMSKKGELFDIITLEYRKDDGYLPWLQKQRLIQACIAEGITFEVTFAPGLVDSTLRRQFIIYGQSLARICNKGRGLILSSGTDRMIGLRAPYDVANLAVLFGMQPKEGKRLVSDNCCRLLLRSQSRQTIKGALHIASPDEAMIPPNVKRSAHLDALAQVPEFKAQLTAAT